MAAWQKIEHLIRAGVCGEELERYKRLICRVGWQWMRKARGSKERSQGRTEWGRRARGLIFFKHLTDVKYVFAFTGQISRKACKSE
jgi:hypothetical protein